MDGLNERDSVLLVKGKGNWKGGTGVSVRERESMGEVERRKQPNLRAKKEGVVEA